MSIQRLNARKIRQLSAQTGLDLQMAWSWGDPADVMLRTFNDEHFLFNRRTGHLRPDDEGHVSSCPGFADYAPAEWRRAAGE
jgi:hypothetical protein